VRSERAARRPEGEDTFEAAPARLVDRLAGELLRPVELRSEEECVFKTDWQLQEAAQLGIIDFPLVHRHHEFVLALEAVVRQAADIEGPTHDAPATLAPEAKKVA